jgi:hypothetical protein
LRSFSGNDGVAPIRFPTFPEIRNLVRELMATLFLLERPQWLNLALSFQRNPPLRI